VAPPVAGRSLFVVSVPPSGALSVPLTGALTLRHCYRSFPAMASLVESPPSHESRQRRALTAGIGRDTQFTLDGTYRWRLCDCLCGGPAIKGVAVYIALPRLGPAGPPGHAPRFGLCLWLLDEGGLT